MKLKLHFATLLLLAALAQSCAPTVFTAPNFATVKKTHKTVAVLPFDVVISMKKLPKGVTQEQIKADEEKTAFTAQSHAYTYLLKQAGKDKYTVDFQDIDKTNAILVKNSLDYNALKGKTKDEISKILGVDAVMSGKIIMTKPMNDGAAIALGLLVGFWGSTNTITTALTIHNGTDGKLLWKYDWEANGSVGSNTENLTKALMRNVSKNFPYTKK
jgi:Skp family chaperone for outer membrane proteins